MSRKSVVTSIVLAVLLVAGSAFAGAHPNSGCGLGSMVFENPDTVLEQIFASTTNGTSANQTFGISSGTSNCDKPSSWAANDRLNRFVAENMDNLAGDMAKGEGEYLTTLAVLVEVPDSERPAFYAQLQDHFGEIYTSETVSHVEVIENIQTVMAAG